MTTYVVLALLVVLLVYAVIVYNGLVALKHGVTKAWSNIDVLLKQRHDELPKLVETCKQYMQFERGTLEKVMAARAAANSAREHGDVKGVGQAESAMRMGLGNITATVEAYPELKANQSIQQLLGRITGLENAIADRREFYNHSVLLFNTRIREIPDMWLAQPMKLKPKVYFQDATIYDQRYVDEAVKSAGAAVRSIVNGAAAVTT